MGEIKRLQDRVEVHMSMEDLFKENTPVWSSLYHLGWRVLRKTTAKLIKNIDPTKNGELAFREGKAVVTFYLK